MRIVQGALLVLVGALSAMFYVRLKSGPELQPPVETAAVQKPAPAPAVEPAAPEPAPVTPAPARRHVQSPKKHASPRTVAALMQAQAPSPPPALTPVIDPPAVQPAPEPKPAPPPADPTPAPAPVVETAPPPPTPAPAPAPMQATLKAGTLVSVRLQEEISSDHYRSGDTFNVVLDQPLVVDGIVIAEKGAHAEGKVVESQQAGRVKGLASIALALTSVKLSDGQHVEISTDTFTKRAPESHEADAAKIGGGAALGAIIGAIAGGGKGAAIGAGVGGAAGTGAVIGMRGKPALLPSETRISFRINNTVTVTEQRAAR